MSFDVEENIISEIQKQNDIVELIGEHVVLQKRGKNFVGLCPFHNEKTPSFSVSPEKQVYYCFGCGRGGNIFTFLMDYYKINFRQSLELLAERANIPLKKEELSSEKKKLLEEKERLLSILNLAADFYSENLYSIAGKTALQYLKKRGVTEASIKNFKIGFAPNNHDRLIRFLQQNRFGLYELEKAGLIAKSEKNGIPYDRFRGRIIFPIWDKKGRIIAFGGRVLDNTHPKYLNSPETILFSKSKILYALDKAADDIRQQDSVLIMEGYMDVITAHQFGIKNAVATLGTALTVEHAKMLKSFTKNILIAYDGDSAGQSATIRGINILMQHGFKVKIVELPLEKDPDEVIREDDGNTFLQCMEKALPFLDYRIKVETSKLTNNNPQAKLEAIENLKEDFEQLSSELEKWEYVKKLASLLEVKEEILYNELCLSTKRKIQEKHSEVFQSLRPANGGEEAEINILKFMLENKNFAQSLVKGEELLFLSPRGQRIAKIIAEAWEEGKLNADFFFSSPEISPEDHSFIAQLLMRDISYLEKPEVISDSFNVLRNKYLGTELKKLNEKLKLAEKEGDNDTLLNIIEQINKVVHQLKA